MRELHSGPWHWKRSHPDWSPDQCGDTIAGLGDGLAINELWLCYWRITREYVVEGLRPLLELPVEHVLPTHGEPTDRAALERALA